MTKRKRPYRDPDPTASPCSGSGEQADVWQGRQTSVYGRGYRQAGMGFGPPATPDVIKQLLIANVVVFVAQQLASGPHRSSSRSGRSWSGSDGYLWQPFTYMWLHGIVRPHRDEHVLALDVRLAARAGLGCEALPALLPGLRRRRGLRDRELALPRCLARREQRRRRCGRSRSAPRARSTACCSPTRSPGPTARSC